MWTLLNDELVNPAALVPLGGGRILIAGNDSYVGTEEGRTLTKLDVPAAHAASMSHLITAEGAFTSDDRWQTFRQTFKKPLDDVYQHGDIAWAIHRGSIRRYAGGKWIELAAGGRKRIGAICFGHGVLLLSVGKQTVYRSSDLGDTWTQHTLDMRSNEWLTRIWSWDVGFIGVTNASPFTFWTSNDGAVWKKLPTIVPPCWTGASDGESLYLAGAGALHIVENGGLTVDPAVSPGEIRVMAYGPDDCDDNRFWAASRTTLWIGRYG